MASLVDKRLVEKIRSSNAEIENINPLQDGVVEGVQKPRGIGDLTVGEDSEDIEVCIRRKAKTLGRAGYDAGHKCSMTQPVLQAFLVSPV